MDFRQPYRYNSPMRPFKHPSPEEFTLERVLYALSDPLRLAIVRCLSVQEEATCSELDGGRPKSSVSHHFRVLRDSGLLHTSNSGTTHINRLRRSEMQQRFPGLLDAILSQPIE
ncbi:ArsR family transcriptional regulator [Pectobacterium punjabense]|uniref:ArsR family transcriptional regulator n=2 Tax=Pectobacterium punjabense TaxID=2108399 RepID=A0ABX6L3S6_9GAMM|nr:helix-turn-helix transcriptional regulator [Pectobacterium punjabense]MBS4429292.1 helix-turn-helix transcriptional regulator [Pectobacterium punjabense]MBT9183763.1 helix-turn-helix transcriptional regulator [Pectobacterium punjabense]MCE5381987.1 helix-turn-helix transcriptional regulator [Pectobacterium punjabense]PTA65138.1 transcriptional regulator [Pectobacterium punjabense]